MLIFTLATEVYGSIAGSNTADATARLTQVPAVQRPTASSGAGAFACGSARVASIATGTAAGIALPRIRRGAGDGYLGHGVQQDAAARRDGQASLASTKPNLMTRDYPVTPGVVGPYPAREPVPV